MKKKTDCISYFIMTSPKRIRNQKLSNHENTVEIDREKKSYIFFFAETESDSFFIPALHKPL